MAAISASSILAAALNWDLVRIIVVAIVMIGAGLVKKISEKREQMDRAKNPKRPATPSPSQTRDGRFRNEIEAFLDEVGRRRSDQPSRPEVGRGPAPVRPASAAAASGRPSPARMEPERTRTAGPPQMRPASRPEFAKPVAQRPYEAATRKTAESSKPLTSPAARQRPGNEIASRRSPVSDKLGTEISSHLSQYLDTSRMSNRIQADLGNAIEKVVQDHLGVSGMRPVQTGTPVPAVGSPIISLLRNSAGVRAAIVVNEILGPPRGLRRKT